MSRTTGIASDTVINVNHQETMIALVKAMIQMENGHQPYSDDVFTRAFEML